MKILVIGGSGTIGRPLVAELARRGHRVWNADLQHCADENFIRCDITHRRQVNEAFDLVRPEMVYNLAAEFGRHNGEDYYEQCWATNVIGGRHVMDECVQASAKLVHMSSSEAYGETPQIIMRESDTEHHPLRHHNDYAMSKWINEQQVMNMERVMDLQAVRVRFFNAYGPGERYHEYRSVVCLFTYRALAGQPYTVYDGYHRVFMYVDDAIRTLANISENFIPGRVYNVGGEEYREVKAVDALLREILKERFTSNVKYLSRDGHNTVNKRPDVSLAKDELDHRLTINLEDGIERTVAWMQHEYPSLCRITPDQKLSVTH